MTVLLSLSGCGDFFAEKPTEMQSRAILNELSQIRIIPEVNYPIPEAYKAPPKIIRSKKDTKVFYFAKYHTVDKLAGLITPQFGFTVSQNKATNQLVIKCLDDDEANNILEFLEATDVPPIQVKIDCLISELYADVTMDWETTLEIENLLGEAITLGGKVEESGVLLPAFPGAALREIGRSKFGLKVGYSTDQFKALVDLLVSRGYLKILMNPTLEVVNGQTARIMTSEHVPLEKETWRGEELYQTTEYKEVIDELIITPHVFADGYIGLETMAIIGSKSTPEGVKQTPIITRKEIENKENRIRQGESLVIGGIKKTEKRSVVRGVPVLKDIPLLGVLFSSKDFEERAKETIFIITPTISSGGVKPAKLSEQIKRKHEPPVQEPALQDTIMDPFGFYRRSKALDKKTKDVDQKLLEAEAMMTRAELTAKEAGKAKTDAEQTQAQADKLKAEAQNEKQQAQTATANAQKAEVEATKVRAQADKINAEAQNEKLQAQTATANAQKAEAEATNARAQADKAKADAQKAEEQARQQKEQAEAAKNEAQKAEADAKKAKEQADEAKDQAEKAKAQTKTQQPDSSQNQ